MTYPGPYGPIGQGIGAIAAAIGQKRQEAATQQMMQSLLNQYGQQSGNPNFATQNALPQNVGRLTPQQQAMLAGQMQDQSKQAQLLSTMNQLGARNNPNFKPYQQGAAPSMVEPQFNAEVTPTTSALGQQAAAQAVGGGMYQTMLPALQKNPEAIFGENNPISQFAKSNPDAWQSMTTQAKSMQDLEQGVNVLMQGHQAGQKLEAGALENQAAKTNIVGAQQKQQQSAQMFPAQMQGAQLENQKTALGNQETQNLMPYKLSEYKAQIDQIYDKINTDATVPKAELEKNIDGYQRMVEAGVISPELAHQLIITTLGGAQAKAGLEQKKMQVQALQSQLVHEKNAQVRAQLQSQLNHLINPMAGGVGTQPGGFQFKW